jgi:hypothetical protein
MNVNGERDSRSQALISFTQRPVWAVPYTIIIRKGITTAGGGKTTEDLTFPLIFDAPEFMPPRFLRGFFKNGNWNQVLSNETDFGSLILEATAFPISGTPESTKLCLVFAVSEEARSLSAASAMGAFSISTFNNCAVISIKTLQVLDETGYRAGGFNDPALEAGDGKKLCALVYGLEVENTGRDGLIIFSIRSTLADLLGNSPEADLAFTWNKE